MLCFTEPRIPDDGQSPKKKKQVISCVIHHPQNPDTDISFALKRGARLAKFRTAIFVSMAAKAV
jgi:hypothetical protein